MQNIRIEPVFIVNDLDTLKVVSDPLRIQLLEEITLATADGDRRTVKQLAKKLGTSVHRLYYHLALLEKHGLIQIPETRLVSGIVEKHYASAAWRIEVGEGLLTAGKPTKKGNQPPALNLFDNAASLTREKFSNLLSAIGTDREHPARLSGRRGLLTHERVRLTPEEAEAFSARLLALTEEFSSHKEHAAAGSTIYTLFTVMIPELPEESNTTNQETEQ